MAGIYIHIPFCKKKCHYCNFYSTPSVKHRDKMMPALLEELNLQKNYLDETIDSIYFGGGTPSLLSGDEINRILDRIQHNFAVSPQPEITLEANPDDINLAKVKELRSTIINRVSLGVQSFFADDLLYLNRLHAASQSEYAIKSLQDSGYSNLSIDLIYGIPTLDMASWKENLLKTIQLDIPHLSAYALTVEPNTNLQVLIHKRKLADVSDENSAQQFRYLMQFMQDKNFEHYEVSNFCLPTFQSKHNASYWAGIPYLGVGPSAHSYDCASRQWNCSNLAEYVEKIDSHKVPFTKEVLSPINTYNEYIMTALRTNKGINFAELARLFSENHLSDFNQLLSKYKDSPLLTISADSVSLTDEGFLFADRISSEFFLSD